LDQMKELLTIYYPHVFQVLRIDGATPGKARATQCEAFNNEDSKHSHLLLLNYKAAGEGINLSRGQHVFLLDPWFTPSVEDQAVARVIRQGNTNEKVGVHRFLVENSIEERVQEIAAKKREESRRLLSMGLEHRAKMVQSTMEFSKESILRLLQGDGTNGSID
jgi:DNA repair protein RAD5